MQNFFLPIAHSFLAISKAGAWVPSRGFLYLVLVIGAFLAAGVAMSAFSFYEDFYWGDKDYRDQLRLHPMNRFSKASKSKN